MEIWCWKKKCCFNLWFYFWINRCLDFCVNIVNKNNLVLDISIRIINNNFVLKVKLKFIVCEMILREKSIFNVVVLVLIIISVFVSFKNNNYVWFDFWGWSIDVDLENFLFVVVVVWLVCVGRMLLIKLNENYLNVNCVCVFYCERL